MRLEHDQSTHPRLLRKPALGEASAATHITATKKPEKRRGSRFVGATHLDDDQKAQICDSLRKRNIGDDIGRQIFIGALEYQISTFAHQLQSQVLQGPETDRVSHATEDTLGAIVEKASALSGLLRQLSDNTKESLAAALADQDERSRGYDERYLCELGCEIDRLERACSALGEDLEPTESVPDPTSSRDFVAKLTNVFWECFEIQPDADADGPFRASLQVLGDVTGLVIGNEPEFLAEVLAGETRK